MTTAAAATAAAGMVTRRADATPALARITYPSAKLVNVKEMKVDDPVQIQYPDKDSPGVIIKLGRKDEGGVGPEGDIVAFSTLWIAVILANPTAHIGKVYELTGPRSQDMRGVAGEFYEDTVLIKAEP